MDFGPDQLTSSKVIKLDFISQPSSKSTLPLAGLEYMQEHSIISLCSMLLIQIIGGFKIVSSVGGLCPRPLSHESSALISRTRLLWLGKCFFIISAYSCSNKNKIGKSEKYCFFQRLRVASLFRDRARPSTEHRRRDRLQRIGSGKRGQT